ncbi:MAG: 1,4-dihydroxy-2-naphthoate octaprenyltransferase [Bacteroidota bacterium]|jgi:1,4-dihydroxy-2-naphthoate octaprenyltransferase
MNVKVWIQAMRLRTLPLAVSGILAGTFVADLMSHTHTGILVYALLTAVLLQIISNLANDYGDFIKGTDNENRVGNVRALQSGAITPRQMKAAIVLFCMLALACGIRLLLLSTEGRFTFPFIAFLMLGLAAIAAAINYTIGKKPYGYRALGDVFVFLFFGPVAVAGTFMLHTSFVFVPHEHYPLIFASVVTGALSTAVLNTNNIRDIENDRAYSKITLVVKYGISWARKYHAFLICTACVSAVALLLTSSIHELSWISMAAFIPAFLQLRNVWITEPSPAYNAFLKQLSLATLLWVILLILTSVLDLALQVYEFAGQFYRQ